MYQRAVLIMLLMVSGQAFREIQEEDGILVLTEVNFDTAIKQFPYLLVEFYAPWCGHCKELLPEFVIAAVELKDEHIRIAKVDCTVEKKLAVRFQVKGYPTIKFFRSGKENPFDGKRKAPEIVEWLKNRSVPLVTHIENSSELNLFNEAQGIILMYFSKSKQQEVDQVVFESVASKFEGVFFGLSHCQELRHHNSLNVEDKIVLFTPRNPQPIIYKGDITREGIAKFINEESFSDVLSYNLRERKHVEDDKNPSVFLILDDEGESETELIFRAVAGALRNVIKFTCLNKHVQKERDAYIRNKLPERFGAKEFPSIYIYDTRENPPHKFQLPGDINEENLNNFVLDWQDGRLEPYYKSEKVPIQKGYISNYISLNTISQISDVKQIVGKSFSWEVIDKVLDDAKDVFVMFYANWDQNCKKLLPILETLAKSVQKSDIIIGKFDAIENEVQGLSFAAYPTFKLFKNIDGKLKIVDFYGIRSLDGLTQFLKENASKPFQIKNSHDDL